MQKPGAAVCSGHKGLWNGAAWSVRCLCHGLGLNAEHQRLLILVPFRFGSQCLFQEGRSNQYLVLLKHRVAREQPGAQRQHAGSVGQFGFQQALTGALPRTKRR